MLRSHAQERNILQNTRMRIKACLENLYLKSLNFLHKPFVKYDAGNDPYHVITRRFIDLTKKVPAPAMLEIGSRNVTGITRRDSFSHCREYVGLDIHPGDGVDIVGDIHNASKIFPPAHFDFVYSSSVFEHVLFPWKAVLEINEIMKPGGFVFLSTHPVWPAHELPWDFWRFPRNGICSLFNKFTGFEILSVAEGLPCRAYSLVGDPPTRGMYLHRLNQGIAVIAEKKDEYRKDLLKWDISIEEIIATHYPIQ